MTVFYCRKLGCGKEAKPGCDGLCLPHALEEQRQRHAGEKPEPARQTEPQAEPEDKKENEMGSKTAECKTCKRELNEGERVYKGDCKECRSKGVRPRAPRKPKAIPLPERPAGDKNMKKTAKQPDMVDHPPHYNQGKIEVADFIEDQGLDFFAGNVVKYVIRAPHKNNALEDLKKARWYLDRLITQREKKL